MTTPLVAIALALLLGAVFIVLMGLDVGQAYEALFLGAFGSVAAFGETLAKMVPMMFTGLSFALAARCGLVNLGAEGQVYMGGVCAAVVGIYVPLPSLLQIPLAILVAFIAGGLWGTLAAWLKVRFGASEMITTIMLNYIAIYFTNFMVTNVITDPVGSMPQSATVLESAQLPRLVEGTRIHGGLILALLCVLFYYVYLWKTKHGFETRAVGLNSEAARYAGINCKARSLNAMFLAGGMAGLAGMTEVLGIQFRLFQNFAPNYGFDGVAVALLGQNSPIGIILSALLFGSLRSGSSMMQMNATVPAALINVIQAFVIIFVVGSGYFTHIRQKRQIKRKAKEDR